MSKRTQLGQFPDMDVVMSDDFSAAGDPLSILTFETRAFLDPSDVDDVRQALAKINDGSAGSLRAAYVAVFNATSDKLGRNSTAHAVVQATFGQISVDESRIP